MKTNIFLIIGLIALTDLCDTVNQLILKATIDSSNWHIDSVKKALHLVWQLMKVWRIWVGFLLSGISLLIWLFVLTKADLNLAFSLDSMRYIMIALASVIFLKEKISLARWAGIACVVGGIVLVAMG